MIQHYKLPIIVISGAVILFCLLYFGGRTKPLERASIDKSRALKSESTINTNELVSKAVQDLSADSKATLETLEQQLEQTTDPNVQTGILKKMSGEWYQNNNFAVSAIYAQKVAESTGDEESWSIAGTTYSICYQRTQSPELRSFCVEKAINALEQAASLNPTSSSHKLNLALAYVEKQPMAGIQMLLQIVKDEPENTSAIMALGDMSVRSGQLDKAVERYKSVLTIDDKNFMANYNLAKTYQSMGNKAEALQYFEQSRSMTDNQALQSEIESIIKTLQ